MNQDRREQPPNRGNTKERARFRGFVFSWLLPVLALAALAPLTLFAQQGKPTLYLIGDSTVKVGTSGQVGWGERIAEYFDPAKIAIVNAARGGRSSRTFLTEGLWDRVLVDLKRGDFVIMQFGHNDGSALFDTDRPRGSIKGVGEESEDGTVEITGEWETVHTFGWYMRTYVADTRAHAATPIVCSPIPRNVWKDGRVAADQYAAWARETASSTGAAFVDLNGIIARRYERMGAEKVAALFPSDHTHTNQAGADINAESVIAGLKALQPCALCAYFSEKAR
jgi:rhamnogalacturonan acetylesterase